MRIARTLRSVPAPIKVKDRKSGRFGERAEGVMGSL
jgi:hypothetical protein